MYEQSQVCHLFKKKIIIKYKFCKNLKYNLTLCVILGV